MICKTISCSVLCIIQYGFNVQIKTQLVSINTNNTLLPASSSTTMTPKDGINDRNMKDRMARDDTSCKKKLYKNFIYNEFTFTYASSYIEKNRQKCQKYHSHILRYINIYEYMKYIYIYDIIRKAKYDL